MRRVPMNAPHPDAAARSQLSDVRHRVAIARRSRVPLRSRPVVAIEGFFNALSSQSGRKHHDENVPAEVARMRQSAATIAGKGSLGRVTWAIAVIVSIIVRPVPPRALPQRQVE